MTLALFPGSFDPVTNGHLDIISRTLDIFDEVVVAVGHNPNKPGWLSPHERVRLLEDSVASRFPDGSVRVTAFQGLLADLAKSLGAGVIVKGVRGVLDLESETVQATVNFNLCGVQTVFLPASFDVDYVSSSLIRELLAAGAAVDKYVPASVVDALDRLPSLNKSQPGRDSRS